MDDLYRRFLRPGSLAFDIGSHVGDRLASFRRLGAQVVAAEPQPAMTRLLRALYGRDPSVSIEEVAVGDNLGSAELFVNSANPTVSSASPSFVSAAQGSAGWEGQVWDSRLRVPQTTLDALIGRYGIPAFIKIDVEGYEASVLAGLSVPVPALSFEFTTIQRTVARVCLTACEALGEYRFNAALGESQRLAFGQWISAAEMAAWIDALPHEANSGDIYAALAQPDTVVAADLGT
jgi:FkbM family methyltransferase